MQTDFAATFRLVILANEVGNNTRAAYRFSDPDGVHTGKSGWSFGICQFDINNNPSATLCLRECGFVTDEILGLKAQTIRIAPLNAKLRAASSVVDQWDERQLFECMTWPMRLCKESGITFDSEETKLHLADYHNQLNMSRGGKMHRYLSKLGRPVTAQDIFSFKMGIRWGRKRPDDVKRRYENIRRICSEQG